MQSVPAEGALLAQGAVSGTTKRIFTRERPSEIPHTASEVVNVMSCAAEIAASAAA